MSPPTGRVSAAAHRPLGRQSGMGQGFRAGSGAAPEGRKRRERGRRAGWAAFKERRGGGRRAPLLREGRGLRPTRKASGPANPRAPTNGAKGSQASPKATHQPRKVGRPRRTCAAEPLERRRRRAAGNQAAQTPNGLRTNTSRREYFCEQPARFAYRRPKWAGGGELARGDCPPHAPTTHEPAEESNKKGRSATVER